MAGETSVVFVAAFVSDGDYILGGVPVGALSVRMNIYTVHMEPGSNEHVVHSQRGEREPGYKNETECER